MTVAVTLTRRPQLTEAFEKEASETAAQSPTAIGRLDICAATVHGSLTSLNYPYLLITVSYYSLVALFFLS